MTSCVAIITARGGSKRIPRKNIKLFLGKPIIAYSIEAALNSKCFEEVMVSTDDDEIAEVAKKYGANVPFLRSANTSDDYSGTASVLLEVLLEYKANGTDFDKACCIYPTAPFVTAELLKAGLIKLGQVNASTLVPVAEFPSNVWRALEVKNDRLIRIWPENENKRSQDLPSSYFDAGQFYWLNVNDFLNNKSLLTSNTTYIVINGRNVQDIDTLHDWKEAEYKYQLFLKEKNASRL